MKSDFSIAVTQLAAERKLPKERVLAAIEAALVSAYKKDNTATEEIVVRLNPATGEVKVFIVKAVAEQVEDTSTQITLKEARHFQVDAQLGDIIEIEAPPHLAGRIAAQTAKQVVMQRLREAERELVYEEYAQREGDIVAGTIQRADRSAGRLAFTIDLDRTEALFPPSEQIDTERYRPGQRLKFYILEVRRTTRGPEVILSRTHKDLIRRLFELEVPEIFNGIVQIKGISREPGSRSKVAVVARQDGVDPVGSCVGLRGIRIQNIVNELQGERIDVIQWNGDTAIFLANAISPAQPLRVDLDEDGETATVVVPDKQLSLAIGRDGQNARLTAKLTGWKIDIKSSTEVESERLKQSLEGRPIAMARAAAAEAAVAAAQESPSEEEERHLFDMLVSVTGIGPRGAQNLLSVLTPQETILAITSGDANALSQAPGVGSKTAQRIIVELRDKLEELQATPVAEVVATDVAEPVATPVVEPVVEPPTTQEETYVEPVAADDVTETSPEEELLALEELEATDEAAPADVAVAVPGKGEPEEFSEDIWKIPQVIHQGPQIRFAEDIMDPRMDGPRKRRGHKKGKRSRGGQGSGPPGRGNHPQGVGSPTPGDQKPE